MKPVDDKARQQAATDLDTTLFVEAAAGTGKTTALVGRVLAAVKTGRARLYEIVAITFTEKAAGELKIRLREELEKHLSGSALREALGDLERAAITTIHSFCASVLRERPVEAAVDPQFAVADEMQRELLLDEAWTKWFETELAKSPVALRQALMREVRVDDLRALAELLVDHRAQPIVWPAPQPLQVRQVLRRLAKIAGTLESPLKHCVARGESFFQRTQTFRETLPLLANASEERVASVLGALELTTPKRIADFDSEESYREAKQAIKELKTTVEEFAAVAEHNFLVGLAGWLHGFVAHFQQAKHERAVLDFDDLLEKTRDLLRDKPDVRRQLQQRYKFLLVDEFQDTDPVQVEIVLALAGNTPGKLFIVGDPKQSIYGFRRADIEMYAATRRALEKTGRVLQFQQNFRSRSTILEWVNEVFKTLICRPDDGDYQPDYIALSPWDKLRTDEPRVTVLLPETIPEKLPESRRAEATGVARYLRQQVDAGKFKWADVALLFRSFTGLEVFEDVFVAKGVPFRVVGGKNYYQRQEIQTLISLLCALDNPNDNLNLVAVLRSPLFGWSDEQIFLAAAEQALDYLRNDALALLRELHEQRHSLSVPAFTEFVFARTHICQAFFAGGPEGAASVANLLKALDLARALEAAGVRTLRGFVRRLRVTVLDRADEEPAPTSDEQADAVQFLTMHKSKGLQFPVVVLADLAGQSSDSGIRLVQNRGAGTFELRFGGCRTAEFDAAVAVQNPRDTAEEIRLLYVAATRAQERLVIPCFKAKGERLDLLRHGFAGKLVEPVQPLSGEPSKHEAKRKPAKEFIAQRRDWQKHRAEVLRRATQPVTRVSPSKLAHEAEPSAEGTTGIERARAMEFGVRVHEALERGDASGLPDDARAMVERVLKSELMARVGRADEVYRELPFSVGAMDGKIDLLFREGRRWTLVDYKTDARPDAEKYRPQMDAYRDALKEVAGIDVAEASLYFVATGEMVKV